MNRISDNVLDDMYKQMSQDDKIESWIANGYGYFHGQFGEQYKDSDLKMLFYGRATNSWDDESNSGIRAIEEYDCPFFRLVKRVAQHFIGDDYIEHIGWSNVCKLAPFEGGNPSDSCWDDQFKYNTEIMREEIMSSAPDIILFVTGIAENKRWDWNFKELFPDREYINTAVCPVHEECSVESYLVQVDGKKCLALVTGRPEFKSSEALDFQFNSINETIDGYLQNRERTKAAIDDIQTLEWHEHIRLRPEMYIAGLTTVTSPADVQKILIKEVIDYVLSESPDDCTKGIIISKDKNSSSVRTSNWAIPFETIMRAAGAPNQHGMGSNGTIDKKDFVLKVVNSLSNELTVCSCQANQLRWAKFSLGQLLDSGSEPCNENDYTLIKFSL